MKSNIEFLYEELRKATDGGSESMTHDDALKQIAYWRDKCSQVQQVAVPAPMTDVEIYVVARLHPRVATLVPHLEVANFARAIEKHHGIGAKP